MRAFVAGIRDEDDGHLVTAHVHPEASAVDEYEGDGWITLNQTYTYGIVHRRLLDDYRARPGPPVRAVRVDLRGRARRHRAPDPAPGVVGAHLRGDRPVHRQPARSGSCRRAGRPPSTRRAPGRWATLGASFARSVVDPRARPRSAMCSSRASARRPDSTVRPPRSAEDGSLVVAYIPTPRVVSVDLGALGGWITRVRWFDPLTGAWSEPAVPTRRGIVQIASPGRPRRGPRARRSRRGAARGVGAGAGLRHRRRHSAIGLTPTGTHCVHLAREGARVVVTDIVDGQKTVDASGRDGYSQLALRQVDDILGRHLVAPQEVVHMARWTSPRGRFRLHQRACRCRARPGPPQRANGVPRSRNGSPA